MAVLVALNNVQLIHGGISCTRQLRN